MELLLMLVRVSSAVIAVVAAVPVAVGLVVWQELVQQSGNMKKREKGKTITGSITGNRLIQLTIRYAPVIQQLQSNAHL